MKNKDLVIVEVYDATTVNDTGICGKGYLIDTYKVKATRHDMCGEDFEIFAKVSLFQTWKRFDEENKQDKNIMVTVYIDRMKILTKPNSEE